MQKLMDLDHYIYDRSKIVGGIGVNNNFQSFELIMCQRFGCKCKTFPVCKI